ncbi:MAG: SET domain-containing protein [Planctomycetes bacterium]|nr:SET domain-containing protein [Planctomycetota bacterium]
MNGQSRNEVSIESPFTVRASCLAGQGLCATRSISVGQKIEYFEGYEIDHPTGYSLTFNGIRIEPTGSLRFLNHSCSPNAFFVDRELTALRDIDAGEEITIDYLATESEISKRFKCECGSKKCRDWIGNHKKES